MKPVDAEQFETVRRSMLRRFGRMSSRYAKDFIITLDHYLESEARLEGLSSKWRGNDDGLFTVAGRFSGDAASAATRLLAALDEVAFGDQAVATSSVREDRVVVSFATWDPEDGLATVRIEAVAGSASK